MRETQCIPCFKLYVHTLFHQQGRAFATDLEVNTPDFR